MNPQIFREYDIRGVADRDLTDDVALAIGRAAGTVCAEQGKRTIVVGRDCRLSSKRLRDQVIKGLVETGRRVIQIEVGPTPLLYFAVHHLDADGGVMITGSHNPPEDNGFKVLVGKDTVYGDDIRELGRRALGGEFTAVGGGSVVRQAVSDAYIAFMRGNIRLARTDLRVVVDAGNGAGGPLALATMRALGIQPDALYCDMDGRFPNHHPDPTVPENVADLVERVVSTGADLGIAFDGDADRIGAVDRNGDIVWGDKLLIAFARSILARRPGGAILGEVKCSQTLYDDIAKHGGRPILWKTGHSLIKARMKQEHALAAGEMSGHMFFADRYYGYDDAIYAALRLLEILAAGTESLGEILRDVPATSTTPEIRVECPEELKFQVVQAVLAHYRPLHDVIDVDGARIDFGDGWGLVRASNTQPVLVLRFEANTPERRDELRAEVEQVVAEARAR